jgi:TP901 family phage tail tape measure protein
MPTLRVAIDASRALQGANVFAGAAKQVNIHATTTIGSISQLNSAMNKSGGSAIGAVPGIRTFLTTMLGFVGIRAVIKTLTEFETGVVGVIKTTNMSIAESKLFEEQMIALSTKLPIATTELLDIAKAAGQLGVRGNENLLLFTDTIGKLGVAANVQGEIAATRLAQILNITGESPKNIKALADALVNLGNNTAIAGAESQLLRIANEVARGTATFKISSIEITALAAAYGQLGVRAESAGTASYKVFKFLDSAARQQVGAGLNSNSLQQASSVLGVDPETYQQKFRTSASETFKEFVQGLGRIQQAGGNVNQILDEMGLRDNRLRKSISGLGANTEVMNKAFEIARKSGGALDREAGLAFGTLARQWQLFKNTVGAAVLQLRDQKGILTDSLGTVTQAIRIALGLETVTDKTTDTVKRLATAFTVVGRVAHDVGEAVAIFIGIRDASQSTSVTVDALVSGFKLLALSMGAVVGLTFIQTLNNARLTILGMSAGLTTSASATTLLMISALGVGAAIAGWALGKKFLADLESVQKAVNAIGNFFGGADDSKTFEANMRAMGFTGNGPGLSDAQRREMDARAANARQSAAVDEANRKAGIDPLFGNKDLPFGDRLTAALDAATSSLGGFIQKSTGLARIMQLTMNELEKNTNKATHAQADYYDAVDTAIDALYREREVIGKLPAQQDEILKRRAIEDKLLKEGVLTQEEMNSALDEYVDILRENEKLKSQANIDVSLRELKFDSQLLGLHNDQLDIEKQKREILNDARRRGIALDQEEIDKVDKVVREVNRLQKAWEKVWAIADGVGEAFGQAFEDFLTGAKSAKDAVVDLGKSIEKLLIQQLISQPIAKGISNFIGPLIGSYGFGLTSTVASNGGATVAHAAGGLAVSPTFFRAGGANHVYGESGPERMLPEREYQALVNRGGGVTKVEVHFHGVTDMNAFKRSERQIASKLKGALNKG